MLRIFRRSCNVTNRDLVWQWNNTGIFTEIFQEIFQEIMSSNNQEFLPLYRIQSFGKICRYAPYFLIKDYTYQSIWRNSMHQTLRHFSRIFTEIFQESSKNISRIFFFFFFFFRFFQESFFIFLLLSRISRFLSFFRFYRDFTISFFCFFGNRFYLFRFSTDLDQFPLCPRG